MTWLAQLHKNSLLVFFLFGGLLFAIAPPPKQKTTLHISKATLMAFRIAQASRLGLTQLSALQTAEVDRRIVWDALLAQNALRLGLDRGDHIVQQRLVQKMLFLSEYLDGVHQTPNKKALKIFFNSTRSKWRHPPRLALSQVFFATYNPKRVERVRKKLLSNPTQHLQTPPPLGDNFPLPRSMRGQRWSQLQALFGPAFVKKLKGLPTGRWSKLLQSKLGWHLVRIHSRKKGRFKTFVEAERELREEWTAQRKKDSQHRLLRRLYKRYRPHIAGYPANAFRP